MWLIHDPEALSHHDMRPGQTAQPQGYITVRARARVRARVRTPDGVHAVGDTLRSSQPFPGPIRCHRIRPGPSDAITFALSLSGALNSSDSSTETNRRLWVRVRVTVWGNDEDVDSALVVLAVLAVLAEYEGPLWP